MAGRAVQRRQLALLALLASARSGVTSRDRLIGFLWPESETSAARHLLADSVYVLRKELGDVILARSREDVRLDPERVRTDVEEFRDALERDDAEAALQLYTGAFLQGFYVDDAPEFERWVETERARYLDLARKAARGLVRQAREAGRLDDAAHWARRALEIDPLAEEDLQTLLELLGSLGHRSGAQRAYESFARRLRSELGLEPSERCQQLIETIRTESRAEDRQPDRPASAKDEPSFGPRSAAANSASASPGAAEQPAERLAGLAAPPAPPLTARRTRRGRRMRIGASLFAILAALWFLSPWPANRKLPTNAAAVPSIAVLPFENLGADTSEAYFSAGMTNDIITRLAQIPGLAVISRTSVLPYRGQGWTLARVAGELGVDYVLEGTVQISGDRMRVTAQLIEAAADRHLWAESYDRGIADVFAVQTEVAERVAAGLQARLPAAFRRLAPRPTRSAVAYDFYLRGKYVWERPSRQALLQSIDYFGRAVKRDTTFAQGYAGLAEAYMQLPLYSDMSEAEAHARAKEEALRALSLDPSLAGARTALAMLFWQEGDWQQAEAEFRRTIELNPSHAPAHQRLAILLSGTQRVDEALADMRTAERLDPRSSLVSYHVGIQLLFSGRFEEAIEQWRRTEALAPEWWPVHDGLAVALAEIGRGDEALAQIRRAVALAPDEPDLLADLAYVLGSAGRSEDAHEALGRGASGGGHALGIGIAYAGLGDFDGALAWLNRADWTWSNLACRNDPRLDSLRADPRFAEIIEQAEHATGLR